jgi:hypothetical protein
MIGLDVCIAEIQHSSSKLHFRGMMHMILGTPWTSKLLRSSSQIVQPTQTLHIDHSWFLSVSFLNPGWILTILYGSPKLRQILLKVGEVVLFGLLYHPYFNSSNA